MHINYENILNYLFTFNTFVFLFNIIIFIFWKKILLYLDTYDLENKNEENKKTSENIEMQNKFLKLLNIIIFVFYFLSLFLNIEIINNLIKILVVIIFLFFINRFLIRLITKIYWEKIEVNWEEIIKKWYKTKVFSIIWTFFIIIIWIYIIIEILWFENWLTNWWFIWWLLAFLWFTAPVWATDMFSSILILHSNRIDMWDVIKFELYWREIIWFIKFINLSEVVIVDLVYNNIIIIRPSELKNMKILNLSIDISLKRNKNIMQIINANIDYKITLEQMKNLFNYTFELIKKENEELFNKYFIENSQDVKIKEFWDYAINYQLIYKIKSPFYIIEANRFLNEYLQKSQIKFWITFDTPILINTNK